MGELPLLRSWKADPVERKRCLLDLGFSLILRCLRLNMSALRGPVALLATIEACVQVGFLPRVFQILLEVAPAWRTGFLPFARVLAMVSTAFAAGLSRLVIALRPIVFVTVAATGLALELIGVLSLGRQVIAGLSVLAILLQVLFCFNLAKLHLDRRCHADHPD